jgi:phosphomannomutase
MKMISNKYIFDQEIIREYDIRGEYGKNINAKDAYLLGCSMGTYLIDNNISSKICIGGDGRNSSPVLKKNLINGIIDVGIDVVELGFIPTPILYYGCHTIDDAHTGIIVTASHNPKEYNGFKIVVDKKPFYGDSLRKLCNIALSGKFKFPNSKGVVSSLDITEEYINKITDPKTHFSEISYINFKIVWDVSNGIASNVLKKIIKKLPGQHIIINDEVDGNFPSHPPDPTKEENLLQIKSIINKEACDFGIALDGDADRLVLIDKSCRVFYGDELLAFFTNDLLKRHPKANVISDIKVSRSVLNQINILGATPIIWKTGHSHIKSKMLAEDIMLGGEVSGHLYFKENYYGYDDALFAACKLIFLLDRNNREYLSNLPKTFISNEIRILCEINQKFCIINKIKDILHDQRVDFI